MRSSIRNKKSGILRDFPKLLSKKSIKWVAALAVALLPFLSLSAQKKETDPQTGLSVKEVFSQLHTPGLEAIRKSARLDLLDYWEADSVYKVGTVSGGAAWIEAYSKDYICVRVSPVSVVELKILPLGKKKIIGCLYTVGDSVQAKDTEVNFYDSSLHPLDKKKFFTAPDLRDFFKFPKGDEGEYAQIREAVPFPTVAYSFSPDTFMLTARLTVEDYISPDDVPLVKKYMVKELTSPWKGKYRFK